MARTELRQGRNVLKLWRKGTLTLSGELQLEDVVSAEFEATLASWHSSKQINVVPNEDGQLACEVPVGEYRWLNANGEWVSVSVQANAEAIAR